MFLYLSKPKSSLLYNYLYFHLLYLLPYHFWCGLCLSHLPPTLNIKYIYLKDTDAILSLSISTNLPGPALFPFFCHITVSEPFPLSKGSSTPISHILAGCCYSFRLKEKHASFPKESRACCNRKQNWTSSKALADPPNIAYLHCVSIC